MLCPCKDWESTLQELFERWEALGLPRALDVQIVRLGGHTDGAVRKSAKAFLSGKEPEFEHALVIFDHQGCGSDDPGANLELQVEQMLARSWQDRARCVVVEPELEEWLVGAHAHLSQAPGFKPRCGDPRMWWRARGLLAADAVKPADPKEAIQQYLLASSARPDSVAYRAIARKASLRTDRCRSRSFHRFVDTLQAWWPR